jgi:Peptidase family S41
MSVQSLEQFNAQVGTLTPAERGTLVAQATVLIEQIYAHLPLKKAIHAIDPVQRLRNLSVRLAGLSEREFHDELIAIFTELRDLHTNYLLPKPYAGKIAFLPFLVEQAYGPDGAPVYLVSKLLAGFTHPSFGVGAQVTHWSGAPIDRAVEVNAARQAGSNLPARHARGLEALTLRDMSQCAPPDELWVLVRYIPAGAGDPGAAQELRLDWRVFAPEPTPNGVDPSDAAAPAARVLGYDAAAEARRRAKKELFNPAAMVTETAAVQAAARAAGEPVPQAAWAGPTAAAITQALSGAAPAADPSTTSTLPDVFSFKTVTTPSGEYGYLRIWTFMVDDENQFLAELVRILGLLPATGLIIDVRGNGGGNLLCAEGALQLFTPREVQPTLLSFLATPLTLALCTGKGAQRAGLDMWHAPITLATQTGTPFSQGLTIIPESDFNTLGQRYQGPVVLVTDALIYSATDMFTAGFRDNGIGRILGTDPNTGAGGANVWTYDLFRELFPGNDFPFRPLPKGATFRVSFRRTIRQGAAAGTPVEDLGIVPDKLHKMTPNDILNGNADLLAAAGAILAGLPARTLSAELGTATPDALPITLDTKGLDRVDIAVDNRPVASVDVLDSLTPATIRPPSPQAKTLTLTGYDQSTLCLHTTLDL